MPSGTVKWFNPTKGYGFIQLHGGGGKDVFVHISAVEKAGLSGLPDGAKVAYDISAGLRRSPRLGQSTLPWRRHRRLVEVGLKAKGR
jgi:cold shock protein